MMPTVNLSNPSVIEIRNFHKFFHHNDNAHHILRWVPRQNSWEKINLLHSFTYLQQIVENEDLKRQFIIMSRVSLFSRVLQMSRVSQERMALPSNCHVFHNRFLVVLCRVYCLLHHVT